MNSINIEDLIFAFTHMLFERRVLLIVPKVEDQIPLFQALHSLIYPFEYCLTLPCLKHDPNSEFDQYFEDCISAENPYDQFVCIPQEDKQRAFAVLENDTKSQNLLIIDLNPSDKPKVV